MKIAIIGSRRIGTGLGALWAQRGHDVRLGHCKGAARLAPAIPHDVPVSGMLPHEAVRGADVVLLAAEPRHLDKYLESLGSLAGLVVIDAYDVFERAPDGSSMSEYLTRVLPGARIVKAFDTVRWYFEPPARTEGPFVPKPHAALGGGDAAARSLVSRLIADLGLTPREVGARADLRPAVHLAAVTA